ncbi:MAG: transposase [Chloroflexi bacterium]|nr:transposase [Chloroflexota bacterium]
MSTSSLDSGWSMFGQCRAYQAESAGRVVAAVDPAYTSKSGSNCGTMFAQLTLSDRGVGCDCGLSLDRDHNAAINILKRTGWGTPVGHNMGGCAARAQEAAWL